MESNANLSARPVHKATCDYLDKRMIDRMTDMEGRFFLRMSQREKEMDRRHIRNEAELRTLRAEIAELRDKNAELEATMMAYNTELRAELEVRIERLERGLSTAASKHGPLAGKVEKRSHGEAEIRKLILANGHKFFPGDSFNSRTYAQQLAKHVTLLDGDKEINKRNEMVFHTRVATTISNWIKATDVRHYGECPFAKATARYYSIKEGFQWPNQAA